MVNCELFSVAKSKSDVIGFEEHYTETVSALYEKDINIKFQSNIPSDPKKLSNAMSAAVNDTDSPEMYIFANALDSKDSSAFKKLFYDFISRAESDFPRDAENPTAVAKIKAHSLGDLGKGFKGYCFRVKQKVFIALPSSTLAGRNQAHLIDEGVAKALEILAEYDAVCPDGATYMLPQDFRMARHAEKKKRGFLSSFIPKKGDSRGAKVRKWVVLVAIVAFIGALGYVVNFFVIGPIHNNAINSELQEIAYRRNTDETAPEGVELSEQDWDALKKINPEIVGWIKNDGTKIDYPVVEHIGDDMYSQYYLRRDYNENYDEYGTIFVDYRCPDSVDSRNVILHGHNMITSSDGAMFHALMDYTDEYEGDLDYYRQHPVMTFNTPQYDAKWKVISVFKTSTLYSHGEFFNYMQGEFTSDAEFMNFVYNCRIRSLFNIPVTVNEDDQILTLSTCSYEMTEWRTVVVLRKVRPGEDEKVDTQLATLNPNPLFPEVYYMRYGGERPDPLTFKTAYAKGLVNWYDGKGDLQGDETLTATVAANPTEPPTEKPNKKSTEPTEPEVINFYTVMFMNYDGSEFVTRSVREGDAVEMPAENPTMPSDDYYDYVFIGWDTDGLDLQKTQVSMNIAPRFEAVLKPEYAQ